MNTLIVGLILILTIITALGLGVMLGYYLLSFTLHLMGHRQETPQPAPQLAASQAHGGD